MRTPLRASLILILAGACALPAEERPPASIEQPSTPEWQVTPSVGARWLVSRGHGYHAVDWKNGGPSERIRFVGDFAEGPTAAAGLTVAWVPGPDRADLAPFGSLAFGSFELDSNRFDFNWEVYTLSGGVRWLFVHARRANVFALVDLGLMHAVGEGSETKLRGASVFELEAESFTGYAAGTGLGAEIFPLENLGLGVTATARYHRAGNIRFGAVDALFHVDLRF